jgi:hypothetical protein
MSDITLKDTAKYYQKDKRGRLSSQVIMQQLKGKGEIVYGARSVNAVVPSILKRHTDDWDIYTDDDPKTVADKIEKALDRRYGFNYFTVGPAKHEGTYKIKSRVTQQDVVDVTFKKSQVPHRRINRINYATLDYQIEKLKDSLSTEGSKFRHQRDAETLQRIRVYKAMKKKSKVKSKPARVVSS